MPANRNALVRYKTIDQCLQNRYRKWTLEDLIEACSDALYEYEGIDKGVSRRTVQADIQVMRSDKLGYNAPIVVEDKKFYTYEDADYSITNIPLTDQDLGKLSEAVEFMKQFQGFSHFRELDGMVQKLEAHIYSQKNDSQPVIDFEKNENLKGLEYLDQLYKAIIGQQALEVTYQSFKARQPDTFTFHPLLLKEFRNRWFLVGTRKREKFIMTLALDRIEGLAASKASYEKHESFDPTTYFHDAIGVTVSPTMEAEEVRLFVYRSFAPYVRTKPLHHSQEIISEDSHGMEIRLKLQHNFELEKDILAFGDGVRVISPPKLRRRVRERLTAGVDHYETDHPEKWITTAGRKLAHKGYSILSYVYTTREVNRIKSYLDKIFKDQVAIVGVRCLFEKAPQLRDYLMNKNLKRIIESVAPEAYLTKAIFFDKTPQANWYVTWHQDRPINVKERQDVAGYEHWTERDGVISVSPPQAISEASFSIRIHLDDTTTKNGALNIIPGTHRKIFSDAEIATIATNTIPQECEVPAGGIMLMKPLLLHASSKSKSQKRRRVIHLEFCTAKLPEGLEWAEQ
ncbi:MAG: WYL domain-containing protein [Bacteroidia bacterium]